MKNYTLLPELLLRTPALPLDPLWEDPEKMQDPALRSARLREIFQDEKVQEALFLGSPNLHRKCKEWLAGEIEDGKEVRRTELSLLRYYLRMSARCTPFGLFAGCTMATWERETDIELAPLSRQGRNTRLDMHYLCALAQHLETQESIRPFLKFYPNSSIYPFGDKIRFIEYRYQDGDRRHQISAVNSSPYLEKLMETATTGAYLDELARSIADKDALFEEVRPFVEQVVNSQLLVSELEPAITGEDLLSQMLDILERIRNDHSSDYLQKVIDTLSEVQSLLNGLDNHHFENNLESYQKIASILDVLGIPYELSKLFQADMVRTAQKAQVQNRLAGSIRRGLQVLNQLRPHPQPATGNSQLSNLRAFQNAFFNRYETREVPLLEVLDNESGIGYLQNRASGDVHPLIDDIELEGETQNSSFQLDERESFLLKKLIWASTESVYEVALNDEELKSFTAEWTDLPDTISVMGSIAGKAEEGQSTEQIYIRSAGGSSAANLLGRFTHSNSKIDEFTKGIANKEQELHPEVIFAEIIHLPEARMGNILMRTQLRSYEIPFMARSSVPQEQQIRLQDLYLSVKNDRLVLRSKKLNKEIIPHLSTAHNFSLSTLPVYQFLCDLQFQQVVPYQMIDPAKRPSGDTGNPRDQEIAKGLSFSWGAQESQFRFLPRVIYRNIILSRAKWRLEKKHYMDLLKTPPNARMAEVGKWRENLKIPRRISLADYDNELFIDLENAACADLFLSELKKRPSVTLVEFLFDPKTAVVKDEKGDSYTNEFIMAFARKEALGRNIQTNGQKQAQPVRRDFITGSEWLYYKFYTGAQSGDQLLIKNIRPLTERLKASGLIDHWFFLRYADPDLHVRLRLHLLDINRIGEVINMITAFTQSAFDAGLVWKVQTDTYQREIERYGHNTMELSEQLFHIDSRFILHFLEMAVQYEESEMLRWFYAMLSIDRLLDCFEYDINAKKDLLERMKTNFISEFKANNSQGSRQFNAKYKTHQDIIEDIVGHPENLEEHFPDEVLELLEEYAASMRPICKEILALLPQQGSPDLKNYLSSLIHMLMNRLFRSQQRKYEMVVYDMLFRGYRTAVMRQVASRR